MNGFAILDKAAGLSSANALYPIKRALPRGRRVGHAGTLDPFATGVLIVLVGDGTKLSSIAMSLPKTYETCIRFGVGTDTLDHTGTIVDRCDPGPYEPFKLLDAVQSLVGRTKQVPPSFSAIKVDGVRSYHLARADKSVVLKEREIDVHSFEVQQIRWPDVTVRIRCGTGTYVRALGRDVGAKLGLPATLMSLRRTAIGPFDADLRQSLRVEDRASVSPEILRQNMYRPIDLVHASKMPQYCLPPDLALRFVQGQAIPVDWDPPQSDQPIAFTFRVEDSRPLRLLGLANLLQPGVFRAARVLSDARALVEPPPVTDLDQHDP